MISHSWLLVFFFSFFFLNNQVFAQNEVGKRVRAATADSDFSGLFKIRKPDWKALILRRKRSNRQGARKVRAGCTDGPNPGSVDFFFRRVRRQLRKRKQSLKSLKKNQTPSLYEAVRFSEPEQRRRSGLARSDTQPSRGNSSLVRFPPADLTAPERVSPSELDATVSVRFLTPLTSKVRNRCSRA